MVAAPSSSGSGPLPATTLPPPSLPVPTFSPLSDPVGLARISVLLVPVGEIDKDRWELWTKKIRGYTEIRLSDVPGTSGTTAKTGKARFLPPSFPPPTTSLHLSFISTPPPTSVLPLSLFRISACPLAVIGLSDLSDPEATHANQIERFENALDRIGLGGFNGGVYPLAKRCFGIDEDVEKREVQGYLVDEEPEPDVKSAQTGTLSEPVSRSGTPMGTPRRVEQSSQFEGVVEIDASDEVSADPSFNVPGPQGSTGTSAEIPIEGKKYYDRKGHEEKMVVIPKDGNVDLVLGMLMTDLCASVLTEFGEVATALESPAGIQAVQASLLPTLTLKPVPKGLTTAHRPKSGNWCHIAVTNNAAPVGGSSQASGSTVVRSNSPAISIYAPMGSPSFSTSQPNLLEQEGRDRVGPLRPPSGMGMNGSASGGTATAKAFTNTPLSNGNGKSEGTGLSIKRSSTGFGFGSNVSRVLSGKGIGGGDGPTHSSSMVGMGGHSHTGSLAGAGSNGSGASTSGSGSGRVKKLIGDLWLLSGRLSEAINSYSEAGVSLKSQGDTLWHAAAMEGLATSSLLEAWEVRDRRGDGVVPFSASVILTNIHDNFNHAFTLYARSPRPPDSLFPHGQESGEVSITNLYASCALKLARTMLMTWASGGFGSAVLDALVTGTMPKVYPPMSYRSRWRVLLKLTTMSKISRNTVSRIASRAHGSFLAILPRAAQLDVFVTLVGVNRLLGLDRREIYFAREAIGLSLALILEGRLPSRDPLGEQSQGTSDQEDEEQSDSLTFDAAGQVAVRQQESCDGNAGILGLIARVLDIAGLSLSGPAIRDGESAEVRQSFGWPEIQVEVLREAVSAAELLPDQEAVMRFTAMGLKYLVEFLSPAAQFRLHEVFTEAVAISGRRGVALANDHWWLAGDLVSGMDIIPIPAHRVPYEQVRAGQGKVETNPFLYNPRAKLASNSQATLVGDEAFDVAVEVTNPFSFDLDIRSLSLVTSGVDCEARPLRFVLPANTVQLVRLAGIAGTPGRLNVDGCRVVLQDGAEKIIDVPARHPASSHKRERKRTPLEKGIIKSLGLNSRPGRQVKATADASESNDAIASALVCEVVPPQPLLWIRSTSLVHGSVITYHGERSIIKVVLENTSAIPVNFIKITFDDNTAAAGRDILDGGNLAKAHAHQLASDLYQRPVLSVDAEALSKVNIEPGGTLAVTIECLGKLGCERATIDLDYGNLQEAFDSPLYSRRLSLPVLLTVHPSLECGTMTVIPWPARQKGTSLLISGVLPSTDEGTPRGTSHLTRPQDSFRHHSSFRQEIEMTASLRGELFAAHSDEEMCLAVLDIYNRSNVSLEFALERSPQDGPTGQTESEASKSKSEFSSLIVRRLVAPGAIERVPIPLRRAWLEQKSLNAPIPVLDSRQFVVSAQEAEDVGLAYLSDFWYRKNLISQLRGWWTSPASSRAGEVVFLHSSISGLALSNYRAPNILPTLRILDSAGHPVEDLAMDDFGVVEVRFSGKKDAQPVSQDECVYRIEVGDKQAESDGKQDTSSRSLLFDEPPEGRLGRGESVTTGFIALAGGDYHLCAVVRSLASGEEWVTAPVKLNVHG